jgi:hypothetical protein
MQLLLNKMIVRSPRGYAAPRGFFFHPVLAGIRQTSLGNFAGRKEKRRVGKTERS